MRLLSGGGKITPSPSYCAAKEALLDTIAFAAVMAFLQFLERQHVLVSLSKADVLMKYSVLYEQRGSPPPIPA